MNNSKPAGVILAGGQSRRMGVERKALIELGGQSLLAHAIDKLRPQVQTLLLSSEGVTDEFDGYGLAVIPDLLPRYRGPLSGLYTALLHLSEMDLDGDLILCPCDAPFIPDNLAQVLLDAGQGETGKLVVVSYKGVVQPTFSLWRSHHLPAVREALLDKGLGGLKHMLTILPHTIVEWAATEPPPFFNVNTPADLETAVSWLDHAGA